MADRLPDEILGREDVRRRERLIRRTTASVARALAVQRRGVVRRLLALDKPAAAVVRVGDTATVRTKAKPAPWVPTGSSGGVPGALTKAEADQLAAALFASLQASLADAARMEAKTYGKPSRRAPRATDPAAVGLLAEHLQLVKGVNDTTRRRLAAAIAKGVRDGDTYRTIARRIEQGGVFNRARATLIARTATAHYYNTANVGMHARNGVSFFQVNDGESCGWKGHAVAVGNPLAHGLVVTAAQAADVPLSHPNCVRVYVPMNKRFQPEVGVTPTLETPLGNAYVPPVDPTAAAAAPDVLTAESVAAARAKHAARLADVERLDRRIERFNESFERQRLIAFDKAIAKLKSPTDEAKWRASAVVEARFDLRRRRFDALVRERLARIGSPGSLAGQGAMDLVHGGGIAAELGDDMIRAAVRGAADGSSWANRVAGALADLFERRFPGSLPSVLDESGIAPTDAVYLGRYRGGDSPSIYISLRRIAASLTGDVQPSKFRDRVADIVAHEIGHGWEVEFDLAKQRTLRTRADWRAADRAVMEQFGADNWRLHAEHMIDEYAYRKYGNWETDFGLQEEVSTEMVSVYMQYLYRSPSLLRLRDPRGYRFITELLFGDVQSLDRKWSDAAIRRASERGW